MNVYHALGPTNALDRKRVTVRIGIILQDRDNNGVPLDYCGCIILGHGRIVLLLSLLSPDWLRACQTHKQDYQKCVSEELIHFFYS